MRKLCFGLVCYSCASLSAFTESEATRRVESFLLLHDSQKALQEARQSLKLYPESANLRKAYLRALSEQGEEIEAWKTFGPLFAVCKEEKESRFLLETLAWGSLQKGQEAKQLFVRLNAMVGACFTHDARAIPLLIQAMRSSNSLMRSVALQLAATMGDKALKQEVLKILAKEKNWHVRLTAIQVAGQLHLEEARPLLQKYVGSNKTTSEEKALAILTLATLYDKVEPSELHTLITSKRAGLRQLACELVGYLQLPMYANDIAALLTDSSPEVRIAALGALGLLPDTRIRERPSDEQDVSLSQVDAIRRALQDPVPSVAITAAWVLLRQGVAEAEEVFEKYLSEGDAREKRMASAALATCGDRSVKLARQWMEKTDNLYVRVNLALGLIGQRAAVQESCGVLQEALKSKEPWMWDHQTHPLFQSLSPSQVRHIEQIPNYPLVVDQMTRLEILSVLSKLRYPHALEAVEHFVKKGQWSVIGSAAGVLLEEGDEAEIEVVRELLKDPDREIRVEAALLLALWGRDPAGIDELIDAYPSASRQIKIRILEAIGKSGHPKAIPFLVDILGEPFQVLRIVAASSLIQCLYN